MISSYFHTMIRLLGLRLRPLPGIGKAGAWRSNPILVGTTFGPHEQPDVFRITHRQQR
jgi:hypothetical protein